MPTQVEYELFLANMFTKISLEKQIQAKIAEKNVARSAAGTDYNTALAAVDTEFNPQIADLEDQLANLTLIP